MKKKRIPWKERIKVCSFFPMIYVSTFNKINKNEETKSLEKSSSQDVEQNASYICIKSLRHFRFVADYNDLSK